MIIQLIEIERAPQEDKLHIKFQVEIINEQKKHNEYIAEINLTLN